MDYKQLIIRGISYSQTQSGAYALLLEHEDTNVKLPVVIGNFEAQSISLGLEKDIQPPRPLTHDLFSRFIQSTGFTIESVVIYQIIDGVFFSNINLRNTTSQEEMILDARTSDAVAMAVRFSAPIYTTEQVLNEAGIMLELESPAATSEETYYEDTSEPEKLEHLNTAQLQNMLEESVKNEDFDTALEIQNELKRRNKKID